MKPHFQAQQSIQQINKGTGGLRSAGLASVITLKGIPEFPGLRTLIAIRSERQVCHPKFIQVSPEARYYVASRVETDKL